MVAIGVASMPTVALANFLLGVVLAIQGAGQFEKLGATDLVASLVAFSILREIGPLITAVIVIGRSGSAITAELGTMKVAEEIEALNVMGIDPVKFLVVPRLLAMIIMMPMLTVLGEGVGLFAGWLISVTSPASRPRSPTSPVLRRCRRAKRPLHRPAQGALLRCESSARSAATSAFRSRAAPRASARPRPARS